MVTKKKKTTIRLSEEDEKIIEHLGKVLGYKLGKTEDMSQSEVIRYSLRKLAALELSTSGIEEIESRDNG
ncbi:MAG: hypothetical protein HXX20_22255 [Chloroflexi bacterium]|nr:hypothetical protein [Chloroflexota bacterium]